MASQRNWLAEILEAVGKYAPSQQAKLQRLLPFLDPVYIAEANWFFGKWFSRKEAWTVDQSAAAYTRLLEEMNRLQADYARTGRYPHTDFAEVEALFYSNAGRMREHLEALAMAQFLWIDQWERYAFFSKWIDAQSSERHLEIGPGHGLYLERTVRAFQQKETVLVAIDVSLSSLETARAITGDGITWLAADFLEWRPDALFDSITMGEVLEHVENPKAFLDKVRLCVAPGGTVFLSTPLHAPMPDHITPFADIESLRRLIVASGFSIRLEHLCAVDRIPLELAQRFLKPIMFCALLQPE